MTKHESSNDETALERSLRHSDFVIRHLIAYFALFAKKIPNLRCSDCDFCRYRCCDWDDRFFQSLGHSLH